MDGVAFGLLVGTGALAIWFGTRAHLTEDGWAEGVGPRLVRCAGGALVFVLGLLTGVTFVVLVSLPG